MSFNSCYLSFRLCSFVKVQNMLNATEHILKQTKHRLPPHLLVIKFRHSRWLAQVSFLRKKKKFILTGEMFPSASVSLVSAPEL